MATKRDYYEILGVSRTSGDDEIKQAFRKLAFQYHPDHNKEPDAAERFKEVSEAYQVLSDPNKRETYNRYGHVDMGGMDAFSGFGDLGEIFESFFGAFSGSPFGGTARQTAQRGGDLRAHLTIEFEEAAFGCKKEIDVKRIEYCSSCQGTGSMPGVNPETCPECHGTGEVRRVQQGIFGRFSHISACPKCQGSGRIITNPCSQCHGKGRVEVKRTVTVEVPAGIEDGLRLQLNGEGDVGTFGGTTGSLYVDVTVKPHSIFRREGADVLCEVPINFAQAALGDKISVPSLNGDVKLDIPSGTQSGKVFRIKGKGISKLRGKGNGDEYVRVVVVTPDHLSKEQRKIFTELAKNLPQVRLP